MPLCLPRLAAVMAIGVWWVPEGGTPLALAPVCGAAAVLALVAWGPRGAMLAGFCAGAAFAAVEARSLESARHALGVDDRRPDRLVGVVDGPVEETPKAIRVVVRGGGHRVLLHLPREARVLPGDRIEAVGRLRSPRGYAVPGGFDRRHFVASRGAVLELTAREWRVLPGGERHWLRPAARLHRFAASAIAARSGDPTGKAALAAIVAGNRSGGRDEVFRDAGIGHVLAVSGLHLGAVAAIAFALMTWVWAAVGPRRIAPRHAAAACALLAAAGYAAVTGLRPSTLRALGVSACVLMGVASDRRADPLAALALAAMVMLAHRPSTLWDPGAQLSFAAAATLIAVFRGRPPGRGPLALIAATLRASLWTALATAPIAAMAFHRAAPAGVIGNLFAIPIVELVALPLGLLGTVASAVSADLGGVILDIAIGALAVVARLADILRQVLPPVMVEPPQPAPVAAYAVTLAIAATRRRRRSRNIALAICALIAVGWRVASGGERGELRVAFVDVGQGDAAVVELPRGDAWLVDAGGLPFVPRDEAGARGALPGALALVPYLRHRGIDRIAVAVISHSHPDHYRGLWALYGSVELEEVWMARPHPDRPLPLELAALLRLLRLGGTRIVHPERGPRRRSGVEIAVLAPRYRPDVATADPVLDENDNSLVLRFQHRGRSVLFTGDIEVEGEADLAADLARADVVKVPHHGSKTSSTADFVRRVAPRLAVISCGVRNRFGFPDPAVVRRWRDIGARVMRTDTHGTVVVRIGRGGGIRVDAMLPDP